MPMFNPGCPCCKCGNNDCSKLPILFSAQVTGIRDDLACLSGTNGSGAASQLNRLWYFCPQLAEVHCNTLGHFPWGGGQPSAPVFNDYYRAPDAMFTDIGPNDGFFGECQATLFRMGNCGQSGTDDDLVLTDSAFTKLMLLIREDNGSDIALLVYKKAKPLCAPGLLLDYSPDDSYHVCTAAVPAQVMVKVLMTSDCKPKPCPETVPCDRKLFFVWGWPTGGGVEGGFGCGPDMFAMNFSSVLYPVSQCMWMGWDQTVSFFGGHTIGMTFTIEHVGTSTWEAKVYFGISTDPPDSRRFATYRGPVFDGDLCDTSVRKIIPITNLGDMCHTLSPEGLVSVPDVFAWY